jgi:hypothetical protein
MGVEAFKDIGKERAFFTSFGGEELRSVDQTKQTPRP